MRPSQTRDLHQRLTSTSVQLVHTEEIREVVYARSPVSARKRAVAIIKQVQ